MDSAGILSCALFVLSMALVGASFLVQLDFAVVFAAIGIFGVTGVIFGLGGAISLPGMQAVLEELADTEELTRPLPSPQKYIDTSYWERAGQ